MGRVPSKDMHTPAPIRSGHIYMKDAHSAEPNENTIFQFFIFGVMADSVYNLLVYHLNVQLCHRPKKSFKSDKIYRKDAQCFETNFSGGSAYP